jgi:hypothetical protein
VDAQSPHFRWVRARPAVTIGGSHAGGFEVHIFLIVAGLWVFGSGCMVLGWIAHAKVQATKLAMARKDPAAAAPAERLA